MMYIHGFRGRSRRVSLNDAFFRLFFRHKKAQQACQIFMNWLKDRKDVTPHEVSQFSRELEQGTIVEGFQYSRESFYRTILKRLCDFGFISKQTRYPNNVVYVLCIQPSPKRGPPQGTWWGLAYLIAEKWNQAFE